ncbi:hypothetical protein [Halococcus hamelinensis]|uniref:hypothetical protein n=1 Tax=Halococcus hamelinensis TaxID=332168 RepID=UPI00187334ED|nr:hypothetical protein [Halococcus hamelinensis]
MTAEETDWRRDRLRHDGNRECSFVAFRLGTSGSVLLVETTTARRVSEASANLDVVGAVADLLTAGLDDHQGSSALRRGSRTGTR